MAYYRDELIRLDCEGYRVQSDGLVWIHLGNVVEINHSVLLIVVLSETENKPG
jgi:hypothetical protein